MAPILVVGASTSGLTMACQLARHGVPVRIVDRKMSVDTRCRACLVRVRTLEVLRDLGVADAIVAQAQPARGTSIYLTGERLASLRPTIAGSAFSCSVCVEQHKIERALEDILNQLGVSVERGTELLRMSESVRGALTATLRRGSACEDVEAAWVIGCDGAQSRVRQIRDMPFVGERDPLTYLVADVVIDAPVPRDEVALYAGEGAMLMVFPLPDGRSLVCGGDALADASVSREPSIERVLELVRQSIDPQARLHDPRWLGYFYIDYRVASAYRDGRVFLVGDAAHVYSPVGGQGMNTGIQDAYNLGWKLALVTHGQAPDGLLDSYERERRPVAQDAITNTKLLTEHLKFVMELPPALRRGVLQTTASVEGQESVARHSEQLDVDYGPGLACAEEGAFVAGPRPGQQAMDVAPLLAHGKIVRLSDLLCGTRSTLLLFPGAEPSSWRRLAAIGHAIDATYGGLIAPYLIATPERSAQAGFTSDQRVVGDPQDGLRTCYGVETDSLYLIRPDGYVAYRSQPATAPGLKRYLGRSLCQDGAT